MEVPILLLFACSTVFAKSALPSKQGLASFDAQLDRTHGNGNSSVNHQSNISFTNDFNQAQPGDIRLDNLTSINFNSIDGDEVEHAKINNPDRGEQGKNVTTSIEEKPLKASTYDKIKNIDVGIKKRRNEENTPFEPIEHSFEMSSEENTTTTQPSEKEQVRDDQRHNGVKGDIINDHLKDDVTMSDHRYDDDDDEDRSRVDEYDEDEDEYEYEDTDEYGIRDTLDDIIRKTVTGRDSVLRRIFSRRRFFRRIIDKK